MTGTLRLALVLAFMPLTWACLSELPTAEVPTDDVFQPDDVAAAWLGDYVGDGSGQIDGLPVEIPDAALRIALDATDIRLPSCPRCVTVTLDSVYAQMHVRLTDAVAVDVSYDEGPVRYTLVLQRYSAGGEVGNAVTARVTIGNIGVETPFFDVSYLLARP